jgi:zinc protease
MLDEGAGPLEGPAFKARLDELAVRMAFSATPDRISGTLSTVAGSRDSAFELLRLALTESRLDAGPLERIRQSMQANLRRGDENPSVVALRSVMRTMYAGHPYSRPANGTQTTLAGLTAQDLRQAIDRLLRRDRLLLGVVGDIDAPSLVRLIDRAFAGLPRGEAAADVPPWTPTAASRTTIIERPLPQSTVLMAVPGVRRNDPDWYPVSVMNRILGGSGQQSRLFVEIREKRGLAYGANSTLRAMQKGGLLIASTASANERVAEAVAVARAEFARLPRDGVSAEELADAKTYFAGSFALSLDSGPAIASMLHGLQIDGLAPDHLTRRKALIDAVSADDVQRVARRLLREDMLTTVVVGKPVGLTSSE